MHHWVLRSAFAALALWLLFAAWAQHELRAGAPAPAGGGGRRILVLYDAASQTAELEAAQAGNLAGRFGRTRFLPFDRYRRGDAAAYDAAIVIGAAPPSASLVADLSAPGAPTVWIGAGAEALARGWWPAAAAPDAGRAVRYKGAEFPRDPSAQPLAAVPTVAGPGAVTVLATALGANGDESPWALRAGNLFYFAATPFASPHEDDRYLVFADLLYEAFAPETAERHRAMVRIDRVGPDSNPRRIRALADLLAEEGVPFSIAVYDSYRDPGGEFSGGRPISLALAQRPQLVAALRHAVARGATLVSQGHTHQSDLRANPGARVSGLDLEYFAADRAEGGFALAGPLPRNDVAYWRSRFALSARHWLRSGLERPILFAAPHDAASAEAYRAAREVHAARYDRGLYFAGEAAGRPADYARGWTRQHFPYEAVDLRGDFVLPENLGTLSTGEGGRAAERIVASAARNLAVRDGFASFAVPWHEDPEALRGVVRALKQLGYRFVSPAEVIRAAPPHAAPSLHRASPVASAASGWVRALPPLGAPVLVALLALVAAMWLGGETLLKMVPAGRRAQRAA